MLHRSSLAAELLDRLRTYAAVMVLDKLSTRVEEMDIVAMSGNDPRPEVMFNTKLSFQFSRRHRSGDQATDEHKTCTHCLKLSGEPVTSRQAVGGCYTCPRCLVRFTCKWMYETGSALYSIGRNPRQFRVLDFTDEMEEMVATWEAESGHVQEFNNIVLVMYCGGDMCAHCALGVSHGQVQCGSVLGFHRDNGSGANSQVQRAINRTLNIGHPRKLSMELRQYQGGEKWLSVEGSRVDFALGDGTEFVLDTRDEELSNRCISDGEEVVSQSAWFHGMQSPVDVADISCGYVARHASHIGDVRLSDDGVIGVVYDGPRQAAFDAVQTCWREQQCHTYRACVSDKVEDGLRRWGKRKGLRV